MIRRIKAAWLAFLSPELMESKDLLTGAFLSREFTQLARKVISRAQKDEQAISLVYIDADGLKEVNDIWGHGAGNYLIKELARAIFANIRPLDICLRQHGECGDEFVLLLPDATLDNAEKVARRIQNNFPGFSWGVTQLEGENDSIELMIERAEQAMYEQKEEKKKGGKKS